MATMMEQGLVSAAGIRQDESQSRPRRGVIQLMGLGEGLPAPLIYRKGWVLLAYLAMESNRMHPRSAIAALLWPDLSETSGLTNLRQVLSNLNRYCQKVFGEDVLCIERGAVGLMRGDRVLFDVDLLRHAPLRTVHLLAEQRVFLDGMEDIAEVEFHAWLHTTRQMLEIQLVSAVESCCEQMMARGRWEAAMMLAEALHQRDPWNEVHARRAMRAQAGNGMRSAALRTYRDFEALLQNELGTMPAQETQDLLQQISGDAGVGGSPAAVSGAFAM